MRAFIICMVSVLLVAAAHSDSPIQKNKDQIAAEFVFNRELEPLDGVADIGRQLGDGTPESFSLQLYITNIGDAEVVVPGGMVAPIQELENGSILKLHFGASPVLLKDGRRSIPSQYQYLPVRLMPGECTVIHHDWKDRVLAGRKLQVVVTYSVSEWLGKRFGFWHGRVEARPSAKK